jgi:sarcosine oxidase
VKVADDLGLHALDLDAPERPADPEVEVRLRAYAAARMPSLAEARRRGGRVCAYELTPDDGFLVGPLPASPDVWLVGGGSGHGFKHGPALGEDVAGWILGAGEPPQAWRLGPRTADGATLRASPARD